MSDSKEQIRKKLKQLIPLAIDSRDELWSKIANDYKLEKFKAIGCYFPLASEIDSTGFWQWLFRRGHELFFPYFSPEQKTSLRFYGPVKEQTLPSSILGYKELVASSNHLKSKYPSVTATEMDAIFIPCLGVNTHGYRLGYGAGYYDRFWQNQQKLVKQPTTFSILSKAQLDLEFKEQAHDLHIDTAICIDGYLNCR